MLKQYRPQRHLRRLRTYQRPILLACFILFILDAIHLLAARPGTKREEIPLRDRPNYSLPYRHVYEKSGSDPIAKKLYIASVHHNTPPAVLDTWAGPLLRLANYLGPINVHFTAVEAGSRNETRTALRTLRRKLDAGGVGVDFQLGYSEQAQLAEFQRLTLEVQSGAKRDGWMWDVKRSRYALRWTSFLANMRNNALEPLRRLERQGLKFDKILFLDDVVFDAEDLLTLLHTREGRYAAACGVGFGSSSSSYPSSSVLRDIKGQPPASSAWPWLQDASSDANDGGRRGGRSAIERAEPARVSSCWGGIVAFDPAPFYAGASPPLRFRTVDDSLAELGVDASDTCLVHGDNPLSSSSTPPPPSSAAAKAADAGGAGAGAGAGVWLNPNVRVGHSVSAHSSVRSGTYPGPIGMILGAWANRWGRWTVPLFSESLRRGRVQRKLDLWRGETTRSREERNEASMCLDTEVKFVF